MPSVEGLGLGLGRDLCLGRGVVRPVSGAKGGLGAFRAWLVELVRSTAVQPLSAMLSIVWAWFVGGVDVATRYTQARDTFIVRGPGPLTKLRIPCVSPRITRPDSKGKSVDLAAARGLLYDADVTTLGTDELYLYLHVACGACPTGPFTCVRGRWPALGT